jgi:serine/threonine protein kinase
MDLVDSVFQNLAAPPSLDSCTRDVYAPECRFDLATALGIASATASAVRHLHDRGVLHGDLYAHNMLHKGHGQVLLGDFGAASVFACLASGLGPKLQRLEARAFGCLLEELLDRTEITGNFEPLAEVLRSLKARCMSELPAQRPLFAEIDDTLARATAAFLLRTTLQH